jgi:hypothetical protein
MRAWERRILQKVLIINQVYEFRKIRAEEEVRIFYKAPSWLCMLREVSD